MGALTRSCPTYLLARELTLGADGDAGIPQSGGPPRLVDSHLPMLGGAVAALLLAVLIGSTSSIATLRLGRLYHSSALRATARWLLV